MHGRKNVVWKLRIQKKGGLFEPALFHHVTRLKRGSQSQTATLSGLIDAADAGHLPKVSSINALTQRRIKKCERT